DLARNGEIHIMPVQIDVILATKDYLNGCLNDLAEGQQKGTIPVAPDNAALLESVRALVTGAADAGMPDPVAEALSTLSITQEAVKEADVPKEPEAVAESRGGESRSVKVDTQKLDFLVDMVGEMIIAQSLVMHDPDLAQAGKGRLARSLG